VACRLAVCVVKRLGKAMRGAMRHEIPGWGKPSRASP
jgi:hypothetical protein